MIQDTTTKQIIEIIKPELQSEHFKARWTGDGLIRISVKENRYLFTNSIEGLDELIELIQAVKEKNWIN